MNNYIETYLPMFNGFYGSVWANPDLYGEAEYFGKTKDELFELIDWKEYYQTLAEEITDKICEEMMFLDLIEDYKFERLNSPKTYNFSNDSIDIKVIPNSETIKTFILGHQDDWINYIKERYQSRSGFMPYYGNNALSDEWDLDECLTHSHKLGTMLEFILQFEGVTEFDLYYDIESTHLYPYTVELEPVQ